MRNELRWAHDHDYEHAFIIDSAINNSTERLKLLSEAVASAGPRSDLAFSYFINHAFVTGEQIEILKGIRPHEITVGLESINPKALRAAGRRAFDPEAFENALNLLAQVGPVTLSVMLGMPGDDLQGFKSTLDYIAGQAERRGPQRVRMARVHWMLIAPGSALHQHAHLHGLQISKMGIPYVLSSSVFPTEHMIEALNYVLTHERRDLFVWEDAEPLRLLGRELPSMFVAGGDHLGGRSGHSLSESEVMAAVFPLHPGRSLKANWTIGAMSRVNGWPVLSIEHQSGRRIQIQFRALNAEPNPFARSEKYDIVWLAAGVRTGIDQREEARLVNAVVDLVKKNEAKSI
jgi:hypothetical protein